MNKKIQSLIRQMESQFGCITSESHDEVTISLGSGRIVDVCRHLKEQAGFEMLLDITAVDYCPSLEPRFHLVYHLYSFKKNIILVLRLPLNGNDPEIDTIETIYPNANWYEREIWDLMGIRFVGHSDMRRILLPQDWEGHPLRKDYPLGYEEVQFTFNHKDIDEKKSYPKA